MKYKIDCKCWNGRHVTFNVFDGKGANCGTLIIETEDVMNFVRNCWRGDIFWNGLIPDSYIKT